MQQNEFLFKVTAICTRFFLLFAAKFSAVCRKTQCILMLNAVRFGAKRKIKRHKNTLQWYKYNPFEPLDTWLRRAK